MERSTFVLPWPWFLWWGDWWRLSPTWLEEITGKVWVQFQVDPLQRIEFLPKSGTILSFQVEFAFHFRTRWSLTCWQFWWETISWCLSDFVVLCPWKPCIFCSIQWGVRCFTLKYLKITWDSFSIWFLWCQIIYICKILVSLCYCKNSSLTAGPFFIKLRTHVR